MYACSCGSFFAEQDSAAASEPSDFGKYALPVRLDPVVMGGAVATVVPQQGIDERLTDKLAVAIG